MIEDVSNGSSEVLISVLNSNTNRIHDNIHIGYNFSQFIYAN